MQALKFDIAFFLYEPSFLARMTLAWSAPTYCFKKIASQGRDSIRLAFPLA